MTYLHLSDAGVWKYSIIQGHSAIPASGSRDKSRRVCSVSSALGRGKSPSMLFCGMGETGPNFPLERLWRIVLGRWGLQYAMLKFCVFAWETL